MFAVRAEEWNHIYRVANETSHEMKFNGEWLKSHKTNRLWYNADNGFETWTLEIWGEWAGIVEKLPVTWLLNLKRFDVRAIVWDANKETILDLGQHMQRNVTSHNINVYNTKPATKRLGRDRGGVGFAIGSHKSDLRVTCYKRTGEPVAQEFQCTGAMLKRLVDNAIEKTPLTPDLVSRWNALSRLVQSEGNRRLSKVLDSAGIGSSWPVLGAVPLPNLPATQAAFIAELSDIIEDSEPYPPMGDDDLDTLRFEQG